MDEDLFEEEGEEKTSEAAEPEVFDDDDEVEDLDIGDELEELPSEGEDEDDEEEEIDLGDEAEEIVSEKDDEGEAPSDEEEVDIGDDLEEIISEDKDDDAEEEEVDIGDDAEEIASEEDDEGDMSLDEEEIDIEDELEEEPSDDDDEESDDDESWIPLEEDELEETSDDEEDDDFLDEDEDEEDIDDDEDEELKEAESGKINVNNIIEEEGIDIDDAEVPPWDEEVEIPLHDTTGSGKNKKLFIFGGLFLLIALIGVGVYIFFESKQIAETPVVITENEQKSNFVTKKMSDIKSPANISDKTPMKETAPSGPVIKANDIPAISGKPSITAREGVPYSFIPKSNDEDPADNLTFFIANQPVWTNFDTSTGALTGTPRKNDVGTYERIAILVSDGRATAPLPVFNLTVIGATPVATQKKKVQPPTIEAKQKPKAEVKVKKKPAKKTPQPKTATTDLYSLPDLTDLIKQSEFQDAAIEYHKNVREVPKAYSLKLEVDCIEESVEVAFKNGNYNQKMFILPINIKGKDCFIVFWGLYRTKWQALNALKTIPTYFKEQSTKPQLIVVKQYL